MQGSLFDDFDEPTPTRGAYGRASAPTAPYSREGTSRAAAEAIVPHLNMLQAKVLDYVRSRGDDGAICEEVENALALRHTTSSPRLLELERKGLVIVTERTRPTSSGRKAQIYVAAENSREPK